LIVKKSTIRFGRSIRMINVHTPIGLVDILRRCIWL